MRTFILNALLDEFLVKVSKKSFKFTEFEDGVVINGSCEDPEVFKFVKEYLKTQGKKVQLLHTDPPYFVLGKSFQGGRYFLGSNKNGSV